MKRVKIKRKHEQERKQKALPYQNKSVTLSIISAGTVMILLLIFFTNCVSLPEFPEPDDLQIKTYPQKIMGNIPVNIYVRALKNGNALKGANVSLRAFPPGIGIFAKSMGRTDKDGWFRTVFYPIPQTQTNINIANIRIVSGTIEKEIWMNVSFPYYVSSYITPEEIPYNGGKAEIKIKILDKEFEPIPGIDVEFFVPSKSSGEIQPKVAKTNDFGEAIVTYTSGVSTGVQKILFSVGNIFYDFVYVQVVAPLGIGTIIFDGFERPYIFLSGSGGTDTTSVKFKVLDHLGNPLKDKKVKFFIKGPNGGESLFPEVATSDENGIVRTFIKAGIIPGPVRVIASVIDKDKVISSVSGALIISSGKISNRHFYAEAKPLNVLGFYKGGINFDITAYLADRFGIAISPPNMVIAIPEAGAIVSAEIPTDKEGVIKFSGRTQEPMPRNTEPTALEVEGDKIFDEEEIIRTYSDIFGVDLGDYNPRDGWNSIIVATIGEEEFFDMNGNGIYDQEEPFVDQGEPFVDIDDNSEPDNICDFLSWDLITFPPIAMTTNCELFLDINKNKRWDGPNERWDSDIPIWKTIKTLFSGPIEYLKCVIEGDIVKIMLSDKRGNPVPGTKIIKIVRYIELSEGGEKIITREDLVSQVDENAFLAGTGSTIFEDTIGAEDVVSVSVRAEHQLLGVKTAKCEQQ